MYKNETNHNLARPEKTVGVEQHRARLEEDGVKLDLTVVRKLQQLQLQFAQIFHFLQHLFCYWTQIDIPRIIG